MKKNIKKSIKRASAIILMAIMVLTTNGVGNIISYAAEDEDTEDIGDESISDDVNTDTDYSEPPEPKDWSLEENQSDVWDVFFASDWNAVPRMVFTMGDSGIGFVSTLANFSEFQNAVSTPVQAILEEMQEDREAGRDVIGGGKEPKDDLGSYQKIVEMIIYDWYFREGSGTGVNYIAEFEATGGYDVGSGPIGVLQYIWKTRNQYQTEYNYSPTSDFFITDEYKTWVESKFGWNEWSHVIIDGKDYGWSGTGSSESNVLWAEFAKEYFDRDRTFASTTSLRWVIRNIIRKLIQYDGVDVEQGSDSTNIFYFDPYVTEDPYTYIVLESLAYTPQSGTMTLFDYFLSSGYRNEIVGEFNELIVNGDPSTSIAWGYTDGSGTGGNYGTSEASIGGWISYGDMLCNYLKTYHDKVNVYNYAITFDENFADSGYMGLNYDEEIISTCSNEYCPLGNGNGCGIGYSYIKEYTATRIVGHKINGVTGEVSE